MGAIKDTGKALHDVLSAEMMVLMPQVLGLTSTRQPSTQQRFAKLESQQLPSQ